MITRSQYEVNFLLDNIPFAAVGSDLMAALIVPPRTLVHCVVPVGGLVIVGVLLPVVFYDGLRPEAIERAPHAGLAIALGNLPMTACTCGGVDVTRIFTRNERAGC